MKSYVKKLVMTSCLCLASVGFLSAQTVELRMSLYKQEIAGQITKLTDAFSKAYPNIKINMEITPNDGGTSQIAAAAAGKLPDIVQANAYSGVTRDATSGWAVDLTKESFIKKINADLLDGVTYKGKVYALPTDVGTIGILYNKAIFKKLGIPVPKTYLELKKAAETLKKNSITPFAGLLGEAWSIGHFYNAIYGSILGAKGYAGLKGTAAIVKFAEDMNAGKANWATAVDSKTLFAVIDWYKANMSTDAINNKWDQEVAEFASGKAAMVVQGQWFIDPTIDAQKKAGNEFEIGFMPFPWSNKAAENKFASSADSTFEVSAQSSKEKQAAALKFLSWMTTPEAVKIWTKEFKLVPAVKGANLSELPPAFSDISTSSAEKGVYPWIFSYAPDPTWQNEMRNAPWAYMLGKTSAEEVGSTIDKSWKTQYRKQ